MASGWRSRREWARSFSGDLTAVLAFTVVATVGVLVLGVRGSPFGVILGLPLLLFAPGYAVVSILYPRDAPQTFGLFERFALGFGMSVALLPLFGLALSFAWELSVVPVLVVVDGFIGISLLIAARRRIRLPDSRRFGIAVGTVSDKAGKLLFSGSRIDGLLNIVLGVSILLAVSTLAFAVASPQPGEQFTEFYLLEEDGSFAGDNNSTTFVAGQEQTMAVGIENHEGRPVTYTVVVTLQRVGNGNRVYQSWSVDEFQTSLDSGGAEQIDHTVAPSRTGEGLRLTYLLYRGEAPSSPSIGNAYRHTFLWIDVGDE